LYELWYHYGINKDEVRINSVMISELEQGSVSNKKGVKDFSLLTPYS